MHLYPSVVPPQVPVLYCLVVEEQVIRLQPVQVPLAVLLAPLRNLFFPHVGWALHLYPSVVPLQVPVLYCPEEQRLQALQVPLVVGDEPWRNWLVVHVGWALYSHLSAT